MNPRFSILGLLIACLLAAATPAPAAENAKPSTEHGSLYRLVNRTGKFSDAECFWSLNNGKEWHSFAKEPTVTCPRGNGRLSSPPAGDGL